MQKKLVKILLTFAGVMLMLTVISRIGASLAVPVVSTEKPQRMKIAHHVESEGEVTPGYTIPIFLDEGLFIDEISVMEGEFIKKGQKLLKLNKEKTDRQLKELEAEYAQLELQKSAAVSEEKINRSRYTVGVRNSKKDLKLAQGTTAREVRQAREDMKEAQKEYKKAVKEAKEKSLKTEEGKSDDNRENGNISGRKDDDNKTAGESGNDTDKETVSGSGDDTDKETAGGNGDEGGNTGSDTDFAGKEDDENKNDELKELARQKKEMERAYYDALDKREDQLHSAQSALDEASVALPENTTPAQIDAQKGLIADKIRQIKLLKKNKNYILSPQEGIVDKVMVTVGELSPATASFIIADTKEDYKIVIYDKIENGKYIAAGTEAIIKGRGADAEYTDYTGRVHTVKKVESKAGETFENIAAESGAEDGSQQLLEITIYLPPETFSLSSLIEVSFENYSDYYDYCVPLSALNQDDKGYFVYAVDTKATVLGEDLAARKVYVEIEDKNNEYAAVSAGSITDNMDIITAASREMEEGSRVRRE